MVRGTKKAPGIREPDGDMRRRSVTHVHASAYSSRRVSGSCGNTWRRAVCLSWCSSNMTLCPGRRNENSHLSVLYDRVQRLPECEVTRVSGKRCAHLAGDVPVADPCLGIGEAQ